MKMVMITGGCGFIGSNLVKYWLDKYQDMSVLNLDAMTYAARPDYLGTHTACNRYFFENVDIRDQAAVQRVMNQYRPEHVIHLAAESHVCRSIAGPKAFMDTNVTGTWNLLEEFRQMYRATPNSAGRFLHVSTDEVFGDLKLGSTNLFHEEHSRKPTSPYAASKAASDLVVNSYHHTYGMNTVTTNCSNNFGPNQHPEKLIPRTIMSILEGTPIIVHGQGDHRRDWIHVIDHCKAIDTAFHKGVAGETYCVGGEMELSNMQVIGAIINVVKEFFANQDINVRLEQTNDRPTDDERYAVHCTKLKALGWEPNSSAFVDNLRSTVEYYAGTFRR